MYLATTTYDCVAHSLYDEWQLVRTEVWVGICKDARACTMLAEHVENLVHVATFLVSGV